MKYYKKDLLWFVGFLSIITTIFLFKIWHYSFVLMAFLALATMAKVGFLQDDLKSNIQ